MDTTAPHETVSEGMTEAEKTLADYMSMHTLPDCVSKESFINTYRMLARDRPGFVHSKPSADSVIRCCVLEVESAVVSS